ncbi:MAG: pentapeptide repeat-containing protein [Nitrospirae bacterium]|nr:pentapeptide repeat-containing protein [Nitrospirota bacterium]
MTKEETWDVLLEMGVVEGQMPVQRWDLSGVKLVGKNLQKAYLRDVNLHKADLRGVDLYKAYLRGADLSEASMSRAQVNRADLYGTNLQKADLSMASFIEVDLTTTDLRDSDLAASSLIGAYLNRANLSGANLTNTNLYTASLRYSTLNGCALINTNLMSADLTGAELTGALLYNIATNGWNINDAQADYIYYSSELYNPSERNKHKISFTTGQFEDLYCSYPYLDVTIESPMLQDDLLSFYALVQHINSNHEEVNLRVSKITVRGQLAFIRVDTSSDDVLKRAATFLASALKIAMRGGNSAETFIHGLMPQDSTYKIVPLRDNFKMHLRRVFMNLVQHDGTVRSACSEIEGSCLGNTDES